MKRQLTFSPVTRVSGLLSIELLVDEERRVCEANCSGDQFRGFELMLHGRKITDAVYFTQRVCGICSMAHGYISARLVDQIYDLTPTPEIALLQQAMLGAEFLQNHLRHFYLLTLPDYLDAELLPDYLSPPLSRRQSRFNVAEQHALVEHYFKAMEYSRKCHDMLALFGGKIPHQHGLTAAGVGVAPTAAKRIQFLSLLKQVQEFIQTSMLPDVYQLANVYQDYNHLGTRPARFISFGLFDPALGGHFPSGIYNEGKMLPVSIDAIKESIKFARYKQSDTAVSIPVPEKPGAYSWVKAPRYQGLSYEGGPLARKTIRNPNPNILQPLSGIIQRLVARCEEAAQISQWIEEWLNQLPAQGQYTMTLGHPVRDQAIQIGDVPRGPLLHSLSASGDQIDNYNIITPSTWNFSPKDEYGHRGPVEEALVGLEAESGYLTQIGQVVRSFDPCLSCATHCIDLSGQNKIEFQIPV
jgi:hydrogenase large subunit